MTDGLERARRTLATFAHTSDLVRGREPQRYLWTDALAVSSYPALAARTGEPTYWDLALRLGNGDLVRLGPGRHAQTHAGRCLRE